MYQLEEILLDSMARFRRDFHLYLLGSLLFVRPQRELGFLLEAWRERFELMVYGAERWVVERVAGGKFLVTSDLS